MPRERKYRRKWTVNAHYIQNAIRYHQDKRDWWLDMMNFYNTKKPKGWRQLALHAENQYNIHQDNVNEWVNHNLAHESMFPHW